MQRIGQTITVEGLPIADINVPSLPKEYLIELISRVNLKGSPIKLLSQIRSLNNLRRKIISDELILLDNYSAKLLHRAISQPKNPLTINLFSLEKFGDTASTTTARASCDGAP